MGSEVNVTKEKGEKLIVYSPERGGHFFQHSFVGLAILLDMGFPRILDEYKIQTFLFPVFGLLFIFALVSQKGVRKSALFNKVSVYYAVYLIWVATSVVWSYTPDQTVWHSAVLVEAYLLSVLIAANDTNDLTDSIVRWACIISLISWPAGIFFPSYGAHFEGVWRLNGVMYHTQRLGLLVSIGILLLVIKMTDGGTSISRRNLWAALILLASTLIATKTRSFTLFLLVSIGIYYFNRVNMFFKVCLLSTAAILLTVGIQNQEVVLDAISRDGANTFTLSGRTGIWEGSLNLISKDMWVGYGFGSFYSDLTVGFFASGYRPPHAHNSWINAAFETGIVGAFLMSVFMISAMRQKVSNAPPYAFALMTYALLCGTTGLVFGGKVNMPSLLTLGVILATSRAKIVERTTLQKL